MEGGGGYRRQTQCSINLTRGSMPTMPQRISGADTRYQEVVHGRRVKEITGGEVMYITQGVKKTEE